jgi:hypothetical protein
MTTPYVITNPTASVWRQYLDRTLPKTKIADSANAYKSLMKRGLDERYWFEYVFEAYATHEAGASFSPAFQILQRAVRIRASLRVGMHSTSGSLWASTTRTAAIVLPPPSASRLGST